LIGDGVGRGRSAAAIGETEQRKSFKPTLLAGPQPKEVVARSTPPIKNMVRAVTRIPLARPLARSTLVNMLHLDAYLSNRCRRGSVTRFTN
jgi:hypothetical protein